MVMDRRQAADDVAKHESPKDEWLKLSRVLANMRNCRGKLMPGWITLQQKPICTIKSQLVQWRKLRRMQMQVATGGQRGITSYFSHSRKFEGKYADSDPNRPFCVASVPA